jgi:hypothetical protein
MTTAPQGEQNSAYDLLVTQTFLASSIVTGMRITAKRTSTQILLILLIGILLHSVAWGEEACIDSFHMEPEKGLYNISFWVTNCFDKKMEEAIKAGVPTTFNFFVKLHRKRPIIWDKKIIRHKFEHKITYDNIQKDFRVWLGEQGKEVRATTLEEAKHYMARVEMFPVVAERLLGKGRYRLAVKAELDPVKLPLRMECILFFVSLWDFETDWYRHSFGVMP